MNALEMIDLTKYYGTTPAVEELSLALPEGDRLCLLGVNGAGKSTTIGMIAGLIAPTSGTATVFGYMAGSREAKRCIGLSPQQSAVAPNLTVEENLLFMGELYGAGDYRKRTAELMESFGLSSVAKKKARQLSGGYERRLSIAMAMVHCPKLLFLDEPTLGLDILARRELHRLIAHLPVTLVLTTHYMEEAETLAHMVAVLDQGRLLALDTVENLKRKTATGTLEEAFLALTESQVKAS